MALFYQPVLNAIAVSPHATLERLRKLCEAIDAEDRGQITLQTGPFVKSERPDFRPLDDIPAVVFHEAMSRLLLMGAHQDLDLILNWYHHWTSMVSAGFRRVENLEGMFKTLQPVPPNLSEKELDRLLLRISQALTFCLPEHNAAVANAPAVTYRAGRPPDDEFGSILGATPNWVAVLQEGIRTLILMWMAIHQQFLDAALTELAAGGKLRGKKLLALRERWERMLALTFSNKTLAISPRLARMSIGLARIKYGKPPHHTYQDAFDPFDARKFNFTPYDPDPDPAPPGKSIGAFDLFRIRASQIYFLLSSFGEFYPPTEPPKTKAEIDAEKLREKSFAAWRKIIDQVEGKTKTLGLATEDQLIDFGSALFEAIVASPQGKPAGDARAAAFGELIRLLGNYLRTQTAHTEFNLDEEPMYFDLQFPRAISGSVFHDCGVYAVRMAYILSGIAERISAGAGAEQKIGISFIFLPVHVGVIATIPEFGTTIVQNSQILMFTPSQAQDFRTEWDRPANGETSDPSDATALTAKFFEDVAAQMYLTDVDVPLFVLPVTSASNRLTKSDVWKVYQKGVKQLTQMFSDSIEKRGSANFRFDLEFLKVLDFERKWNDDNVVPFWNEKCFQLWNRQDAKKTPVFTINALLANPSLRKLYADKMEELTNDMDARYRKDVFDVVKAPLTKRLRANLSLLGKAKPRVTKSSRLQGSSRAIGPVGLARQHGEDVRNGIVAEPPFASQAGFLTRNTD